MALADLAQFLPQEGGFRRPGEYQRLLEAEALKRASFLSSMDQFYAQLEEAGRQFDLDLTQRQKEFEKLLDLRRDYRNIDIAKLGLGLGGLVTQAYLQNKDITYGYDWMDQLAKELGGWRELLGMDEKSPVNTDLDWLFNYGNEGGGGLSDFSDVTDFSNWSF